MVSETRTRTHTHTHTPLTHALSLTHTHTHTHTTVRHNIFFFNILIELSQIRKPAFKRKIYNCIVPFGFLPLENHTAFPGESQL